MSGQGSYAPSSSCVSTRHGLFNCSEVPGLASSPGHVRQLMSDKRLEARAYTREQGEDLPEVTDWQWQH